MTRSFKKYDKVYVRMRGVGTVVDAVTQAGVTKYVVRSNSNHNILWVVGITALTIG